MQPTFLQEKNLCVSQLNLEKLFKTWMQIKQVIDWLIDWLIDWIEFYAVSAIFQPCIGGQNFEIHAILTLPNDTLPFNMLTRQANVEKWQFRFIVCIDQFYFFLGKCLLNGKFNCSKYTC